MNEVTLCESLQAISPLQVVFEVLNHTCDPPVEVAVAIAYFLLTLALSSHLHLVAQKLAMLLQDIFRRALCEKVVHSFDKIEAIEFDQVVFCEKILSYAVKPGHPNLIEKPLRVSSEEGVQHRMDVL